MRGKEGGRGGERDVEKEGGKSKLEESQGKGDGEEEEIEVENRRENQSSKASKVCQHF